MTETETISILQCGMCHRQHDGRGEVLPFQYSFRVPQIVSCGRADCDEVVQANLKRERARRERKKMKNEECGMKNVTPHGHGPDLPRPESKQVCRSAIAAANVRLPYKDAEENEDGESAALARDGAMPHGQLSDNGGQRDAAPNSGGQGAMPHGHSPSLSQEEFVASGKADSANDRLLEFFEHLIASGQVGRWQSRKFLKEICKNDYINNRIDNLRPHFAEKGLKIVNGEVSPAEGLPKSSHYRLLLMSDGEFAEWQRSGKVPIS